LRSTNANRHNEGFKRNRINIKARLKKPGLYVSYENVSNIMGFSDLRKMRERLEFAEKLLPSLMGDCVSEYREEIADLNREQLEMGETPEATPIRPAYRNKDYARYKQSINSRPPFSTPDLILTHSFVNSIRVNVFVTGFELMATDKKTPALLAKYGAVIGLSVANVARFQNEALIPYLRQKLRLIL
jgi:hypothetical protein